MAHDDWRIRIELPDEGGAQDLLGRLGLRESGADELAAELREHRLAVSQDSDTVFVYAATGMQAEQAARVVEKELNDLGLTPSRFVTERWLRGDLGLALDAQGVPVAVVFAPAAGVEPTGPPCVAQGDFELVAMRPVTPGERAALLSVAEAVPGREHVARVTKARLHAALRADRDLDVGARLKELAGTLPQNVEETVLGWVAQAPKRVRLCSAMMIVAPDETTGDRLAFALGAAMVRRLSPTLLAVAADELSAVARAAKQTGVVLEEGLDRISGTWTERPGREAHAAWWRPSSPKGDEPGGAPHGRLVSRLDWTPEPASAKGRGGLGPGSSSAAQMLARRLAAAGLDPDEFDFGALEGFFSDDGDEGDEETVEDIVLDAYHRGRVLRLKYAGAGGLRQEWVTVQTVEDARVQVRDHATGKRSWRWLRAIEEAQIVN